MEATTYNLVELLAHRLVVPPEHCVLSELVPAVSVGGLDHRVEDLLCDLGHLLAADLVEEGGGVVPTVAGLEVFEAVATPLGEVERAAGVYQCGILSSPESTNISAGHMSEDPWWKLPAPAPIDLKSS